MYVMKKGKVTIGTKSVIRIDKSLDRFKQMNLFERSLMNLRLPY